MFSGVNRVHHEPQEPQGVFSKVDRVHHEPQEPQEFFFICLIIYDYVLEINFPMVLRIT